MKTMFKAIIIKSIVVKTTRISIKIKTKPSKTLFMIIVILTG